MKTVKTIGINSNQPVGRGFNFPYDIAINDESYILKLNQEEIHSDVIINCAGLWAHKISSMLKEEKYDIKLIRCRQHHCNSV